MPSRPTLPQDGKEDLLNPSGGGGPGDAKQQGVCLPAAVSRRARRWHAGDAAANNTTFHRLPLP